MFVLWSSLPHFWGWNTLCPSLQHGQRNTHAQLFWVPSEVNFKLFSCHNFHFVCTNTICKNSSLKSSSLSPLYIYPLSFFVLFFFILPTPSTLSHCKSSATWLLHFRMNKKLFLGRAVNLSSEKEKKMLEFETYVTFSLLQIIINRHCIVDCNLNIIQQILQVWGRRGSVKAGSIPSFLIGFKLEQVSLALW